MAVQPGPTFKRYAANGAATVYTIPFLLLDPANLQITLNGVAVTSGFTLAGLGNASSSCIFTVAPAGDLLFQQVMQFQRLTDYQMNGDFLSQTVNGDYDRLWLAIKQLNRDDGRALAVSPLEPEGIPALPVRALRNLKLLAFDAVGNPAPSNLTLLQLEQQPALALASAAEAKAFADESSESAALSGEEADRASDFAVNAEDAAASSASSASIASAISKPFLSTADGIVATSGSGAVNRFFSVPVTGTSLAILYRNDAGVAIEIGRAPSTQAISELGISTMDAEANDMAFAIGDKTMKSSWIQADRRGLPTRYAAKCLGEKLLPEDAPALVAGAAAAAVVEAGFGEFSAEANDLAFSLADFGRTRSDLELNRKGQFTQRVIDSIARRIGAATVVPPFPLEAWACWGDSLTAGGWPATLAALCGLPAYNGGWGGQGYSQIAARQGGVPSRLTVAGNTIPASGPVAVTAALNNPLSDGGGRQGLLAGVLGMLNMAGGVLTFTRSVAGIAVSCPPKSYFTPSDGLLYAGRHVTIWTGRNSFKEVAPALIVASIRSMIDYLTPRVKRVVVMSIPPWVGEEFGTANRAKLDACNAAIQAAFPEFWLDISAWLRTEPAATAAGIAFTSDDLTDIANGLTPRSLRSDSGHLNAGGNVAIGQRVHQESQIRGWM